MTTDLQFSVPATADSATPRFDRFLLVETEAVSAMRPTGPRCWALYGIADGDVPAHVGSIEIGIFGFEFATTRPYSERGAAGSLDEARAQVEAAVRYREERTNTFAVWMGEMGAKADRIRAGLEPAGERLTADEAIAKLDEIAEER